MLTRHSPGLARARARAHTGGTKGEARVGTCGGSCKGGWCAYGACKGVLRGKRRSVTHFDARRCGRTRFEPAGVTPEEDRSDRGAGAGEWEFRGICVVIVRADGHSRNNHVGRTERLNSANFPFQCDRGRPRGIRSTHIRLRLAPVATSFAQTRGMLSLSKI